jgi:hypothetical protein
MPSIISSLIDFMEAEDFKYEILEGESMLRFNFKVTAGRLLCYAEVDEKKFWLTFYSYLPVHVPQEKHLLAAEFVTRANHGMRIGNFEMDFNDGEVRYKTSVDIEGGEITHRMIDNLLRANLSTMNRYFRGFMELIYAHRSPSELISEIEVPQQSIELHPEDFEDSVDEDDDDLGHRRRF